jgi:tyrosine-protein kinase Etk/Wzc
LATLNVLDVLIFLRRHALRILLWGFALGVAGYLVSYLIPPVYQASASILPPEEDELTASLSIARRGLPGLSGLGKLGSYFTQADVAIAILRSRTVHEALVRSFDLQKVYKDPKFEDAIRDLRGNSAIKIATDGTIAVTVSDHQPARAAELANAFLAQLDAYNQKYRASHARRTRVFLEERVTETDSLLRVSEQSLAAYQRVKGTIVIPQEARGAMDAAANVMAEKIRAEIELEVMRTYASSSNEELRNLEARVLELRRKVGGLPATQVGGAELIRQVAIKQQLLAVLTSQLEEARIREVMDTPTIQILDIARPPESRTWPRRSLIAAFGLALGLGIGIADASGRLLGRRFH